MFFYDLYHNNKPVELENVRFYKHGLFNKIR
ncbi:hypothetical protein DFO62_12668 [Serratia fonticola]|nr:hypothetical protein DFO62_12668 [Serratia fonticola]